MLIQLKEISIDYGPRNILENASVTFTLNQKIAVVGRNGAGKSTLCKLIMGQEKADSGQIVFGSDLILSYLEQHDPYTHDEIVVDFLSRYSGAPDWECARVADKFGIRYDQVYAPIGNLSGGYQMRMKLAAMLLKNPNFLILDEPTNYLYLNTLLFLEKFLQEFRGSYLIVSHDREFLKKTCDHTLDVESGKVFLYKGSLEDYLAYKQEKADQALQHNQSVEKKKKQLQTFVDRFGSKASLASSAQSKMKQMQRLKTIEIAVPLSTVKIKMPVVPQKKGLGLRVEKLVIGYPDKRVAGKMSFEIDKGKHVAILGDNGQGKSTFLKTIASQLSPLEGNFSWGLDMSVGYYAQHVFQELDNQMTVLENLENLADSSVTHQMLLDMLGSFLFSGDAVRKKVLVLSGGERARLCLAGLLLSKKDVLLLDEPTNHLDVETVEALATALSEYPGTVFFISHDRTFVNTISNAILEVKNGNVELYPGTYEDYVDHLHTEIEMTQ